MEVVRRVWGFVVRVSGRAVYGTQEQLGWSGRKWVGVCIVAILGIVVLGGVVAIAFPPQPLGAVKQGDYAPFSSKQEYDAFMKTHPLMNKQAPENAHFYFKASVSRDKQAIYQVNLLSTAVKPGSAASFQRFLTTLVQSQNEAKAWMRQNGGNPGKDYIIWSPDPASFKPTPIQTPHAPIGGPGGAKPTPTPTVRFPQ